MPALPTRILIGAVFLLFLQAAPAVILDWDTVMWTPGNLTDSYDIDPDAAGNDVTITVTGDTLQLQPRDGFATPAILNTIEGGLVPAQNSLVVAIDLAASTQSVTFTLSFSSQYASGVENVSFSIFDVDLENTMTSAFQDQIRFISGLSVDGTTLIPATITTSSTHVLGGTGLNQTVTGTSTAVNSGLGSEAGNITISFGPNAITSFTFTYGSGPDAPLDPTFESIGIHDISFTPVPEINPAWGAAVACLVLGGWVLRRRHLSR